MNQSTVVAKGYVNKRNGQKSMKRKKLSLNDISKKEDSRKIFYNPFPVNY